LRIGFDIDGVLADFNTAYMARIVYVTGRNLFPDNYQPDTWYYPEKLGYKSDELNAVWLSINADLTFWRSLKPYAGTHDIIDKLTQRVWDGDDVYFVTARPSRNAKWQTECWLSSVGMTSPTVLIASEKGLICQALELDAYIDDRHRNVLSVSHTQTRPFLLDRSWNRQHQKQDDGHRIIRVASIDDMLLWVTGVPPPDPATIPVLRLPA
jgi:5'(3')-deoxyribonucleotidase